MKEIWKNIDDRYSVSNFGNVKSNYANKERILKPYKNRKGYLMVDLRHPNSRKSMQVHRLVAKAFIPNPDNLPEVNHKDENKENNSVDNLEWCTTAYNCNYGTRNIRKSIHSRKPVCSVDEKGNVTHYSSRAEASKLTGINDTAISKSLREKYIVNKTAGRMLWFYDHGNVDKMVKENGIKAKTNKRKVFSVDYDGKIEHYISISDAKRETNINNISRAVKNGTIAGGRRWFYEE